MTTTDADVRRYVAEVLNTCDGRFDVEGIGDDLRSSPAWPVPDRPVTVLDDAEDFWPIVARHALDNGA